MLQRFAKAVFGNANAKYLRGLQSKVEAINALEGEYEALSDSALKDQTAAFKARLAEGETLDDLLVEAFAAAREAGKRALGLRMFDVQLMGAMVLHEGRVAEMKTGEGKTLTATAAAYLNALSGKGVHVITVNEYLVQRDSADMGKLYKALGLTTGYVTAGMGLDRGVLTPGEVDNAKRRGYGADVTYSLAAEVGFDHLRDQMKPTRAEMVQRGFSFVIVDEADSVLIDEARTPLVMSGPAVDVSNVFRATDLIAQELSEEAYTVDEKTRNIQLSEEGVPELEIILRRRGLLGEDSGLYQPENVGLLHNIMASLRAHRLFFKDQHYMVQSGEIILINELTGRAQPGRRMGDGAHQALEAKEGLTIKPESTTIATITYQNFFRQYDKIAGMTGTALTEAAEFEAIYNMYVAAVPTNQPMIREDNEDVIYRFAEQKILAIVEDIEEAHAKGQPVLLGTPTVESSEMYSAVLKEAGVEHQVLSARQHEREAFTIAQAGAPGAITIATSMAGRGTDIQLGGNYDFAYTEAIKGIRDPKEHEKIAEQLKAEIAQARQSVVDAGGLYVLGTERGESRRVDNQLRGRSGRQGDPGKSRFYVSLEDDLMRIFGQGLDTWLKRFGIGDDEAIEHQWISNAIAKAQERREGYNFDIRKQLIRYDDVLNDQRQAYADLRDEVLDEEDLTEKLEDMREKATEDLVGRYIPPSSYPTQWDLEGLESAAAAFVPAGLPIQEWGAEDGVDDEVIIDRTLEAFDKHMAAKAAQIGPETMRSAERQITLRVLDQLWREHIQNMMRLREGVSLRAFGQRDPLAEYRRDGFEMFDGMLERYRNSVVVVLANLEVRSPEQQQQQQAQAQAQIQAQRQAQRAPVAAPPPGQLTEEQMKNTKRNDLCPCGSGKKFKHCHGSVTATNPAS